MPVQAFSFPIPETRFFQVGQHIYKFKIRRGSKISGEEALNSEFVNEELEDTDSGLDSPQLPASRALHPANEPKRRRTEEPQEGPLSLDHHDKEDTHLCLQEMPNLSGGAEETVCDNEDSEYPEDSSLDATSPELHEREKAGVLARLARIAAFPFSLLSKRS
ncbi:hypothetical protein QTP70_026378 [Hemibagrus guttatus]|uniref:Uncharacterized protein n=1 Tax=Hemibagrus guttatus TaxID=175788 RepID=A0AAE0RAA4_9TELE|nr:hypothetical protein QTP70_026378 [Hemibagrus guttatus]